MTDQIALPLRYRLWVVVRSGHVWRAVGGALLVVSALLSAWTAQEVRANNARDLARSCTDRAAGREDAKDAIAGAADEAARALGADDGQRVVIGSRVRARVNDELPPLVCEEGPPPASSTSVPNVYLTCEEAETAGRAPIREGDQGYSPALDADGDGVACE